MDLVEFLQEIAKGYLEYQRGEMARQQLEQLNANIKKLLGIINEREQKLIMFKIHVPTNLPEPVYTNLREAIYSYKLNLDIAAYALILRTIELAVHYYHEKFYPNKEHNNFKKMVDDLNKKVQIENTLINFFGAQYQERNKVMHTLYKPTELELLSAIELTIKYVTKLNALFTNKEGKQLPSGIILQPKQNKK